jgi:putative addiction module component (TIGR02574 family)
MTTMASVLGDSQLRTLSVEERFELLTRIWNSILDEEREPAAPSRAWIDELKRRLAELKAHPERGTPWEEFETEMLAHLGHAKSSSMRQPRRKSRKRVSTTKNVKQGSATSSSRVSNKR